MEIAAPHFYSFPCLNSTSDKAQELLTQGIKEFFAVHALEQTAGRGRTGRSWASPKGGLYITMVLPSLPRCSPSLLSLWAGALLARFFKDNFDITIRLKWPNDIFFAGRKLAGILIETSVQAGIQGPISLGMGINVRNREDAVSPYIENPYRAIFLEDILQENLADLDITKLAQDLWSWFLEKWQEAVQDIDIFSSAEPYQFGPGMLWLKRDAQSDKDRFWIEKNLAADGALVLEKLGNRTELVSLTSATHDFLLAPAQHEFPYYFILMDQGNSRTKLSFYSQKCGVLPLVQISNSEISLLFLKSLYALVKEKIADLQDSPIPSLNDVLVSYIASVNHDAEKKIEELFLTNNLTLVKVPKKPVFYRHGNYDFEQLGIDRFLAIEGALTVAAKEYKKQGKAPQKKPHLIASFGSALTLDFVASTGQHRGGFITPGLSMQAKALNRFTSRLPEISFFNADDETRLPLLTGFPLGNNTEKSIRNGILNMGRYYLEGIVRDFGNDEKPYFWVLGGEAKLFSPNHARKDADLINMGILNLIFNGYG